MSSVRIFLMFGLLAVFANGFAQIDGPLKEALRDTERAPVIVVFDFSDRPEGALSDPAPRNAGARRAAIAAVIERALGSDIDELSAPSKTGSRLRRTYQTVPFASMFLTQDEINALLAEPEVESVTLDEAVPPTSNNTIPLVGASALQTGGLTGEGVATAILDTGVDHEHPMFSGRIVESLCFSSNSTYSQSYCPGGAESDTTSTDAADDCPYSGDSEPPVVGCGHGTHVAGIAAGSAFVDPVGGDTLIGVAPGADIVAVQVFSRFDGSYCQSVGYTAGDPCSLAYRSDQLAALDWLYANYASLNLASANMSLGGGQYFDYCNSDPRFTVINNLRNAGVATAIASGNSYFNNAVGDPACIEPAITVGATTDSDVVAEFSNSATMVDLLAPGVDVNSAEPTIDDTLPGRARSISGTSMATPHVAGAFALLKAANPDATVAEIESALESTGVPVTESPSGLVKPRIQVDLAHELLDSTNPTIDSIVRVSPVSEQTNADALVFGVAFSEPVSSVSADDFIALGTTATATLTELDASSYYLFLSGGDLPDLTGTVGVDLSSVHDITDIAGNSLETAEPATDQTYSVVNTATVGGTVSGLLGTGLVLRINDSEDLAVSEDGAFVFPTPINTGTDYSVVVANQPADPWQTCTVDNGGGTVTGPDITDVDVSCETNEYVVGGTVSGLLGDGLVLRNNGGDDLSIANDGSFAFNTAISSGADYEVTVASDPTGPDQRCSVNGGSGTVTNGPIDSVQVECRRLVDLDIAISSDIEFVEESGPVTYEIVVSNLGPVEAVDARVTNPLPPALVDAAWECVAPAGSSCAANGTGSIDERVTIAPGSSMVFTLTATTAMDGPGTLVNVAQVATPDDLAEDDLSNNTASDEVMTDEMFSDRFEP